MMWYLNKGIVKRSPLFFPPSAEIDGPIGGRAPAPCRHAMAAADISLKDHERIILVLVNGYVSLKGEATQ